MNDEMRTYPPKKRQLLRVQPSVARQSQTAEDRADKFMQAVNAMKAALDTEGLEKKIDETHKRTRKMSEKLCPAEENASFVAQTKALAIWNEYKNNAEVKARYSKRHHRITHADVFDYCKRTLTDLGLASAAAFAKAVKAALKRTR